MDKQTTKNLMMKYMEQTKKPYKMSKITEKSSGQIREYDMIIFSLTAQDAICSRVEVRLVFKESHLRVETYYARPILKELGNDNKKLYELINFVNSESNFDVSYIGKLYCTKDNITFCTTIRYNGITKLTDIYIVLEYIMNYQKTLFEKLCIPFIFLLTEKMSLEEAKIYIYKYVLYK